MKRVLSLCCLQIFLTLLYSYPCLSIAHFYSAGADAAADSLFARRALRTWNETCEKLAERVATHGPSESFELSIKRSKDIVACFKRSEHRELLVAFLGEMQRRRRQCEQSVENAVGTEKIVEWYNSLRDLSVATFVGAEWIVISPCMMQKINEASKECAVAQLRPNKFGFNLKHQSRDTRRAIKQICRRFKKAFQVPFSINLENLHATWEEFGARKAELKRAAIAHVTDRVAACQAEIDKLILASGQDDVHLEIIALRVEREREHNDTILSSSLLAAQERERKALKAEFVAKVKGQSIDAAKHQDKSTLCLAVLTKNYGDGLDLVANKYRLINSLKILYEKDLQSLARTEFSGAASRYFGKTSKGDRGKELKEQMTAYFVSQLEQLHKSQLSDLVAMPVTSPHEYAAFSQTIDEYRARAESVFETQALHR